MPSGKALDSKWLRQALARKGELLKALRRLQHWQSQGIPKEAALSEEQRKWCEGFLQSLSPEQLAGLIARLEKANLEPDLEMIVGWLTMAMQRVFDASGQQVWEDACGLVLRYRNAKKVCERRLEEEGAEGWVRRCIGQRLGATASVARALGLWKYDASLEDFFSRDLPESVGCMLLNVLDEAMTPREKASGLTSDERRWLEAFWQKHYWEIFKMALRCCRDEEKARDLAQEVALNFMENEDVVRDLMDSQGHADADLHRKARAFIGVALRNLWIDQMRRASPRKRVPSDIETRYGNAGVMLYTLMKWRDYPKEEAIKIVSDIFPGADIESICQAVNEKPTPQPREVLSIEDLGPLPSLAEPGKLGQRDLIFQTLMSLLVGMLIFCRVQEVFIRDKGARLKASFFADFMEKSAESMEVANIRCLQTGKYRGVSSPYYEREKAIAFLQRLRQWLEEEVFVETGG